MTENGKYLLSVKLRPGSADYTRVYDFPYISVDENIRIYYKVDDDPEENPGFVFHVLEWTGRAITEQENGLPDSEIDNWYPILCTVETFCHGVAYYDGIRHLYFGSEDTGNYGYHYYPDMDRLKLVAEELGRMEKKYCREDML